MDSVQPTAATRNIHLTKEFIYVCLQDPAFFNAVPVFMDLADTAAATVAYAADNDIPPRQALWGCVVAIYKRISELPAAAWEPQLTAYIQARTGGKPIKLAIPRLFS